MPEILDSTEINYPSLRDYRKLQEIQKLSIKPLSWLGGLWGESYKIHQWIGRYAVLSHRWFLFTWKPSTAYMALFEQLLQQKILETIRPLLNYCLLEGWKVLSKPQYNYLAVLKLFLELLEKTPWRTLGAKDSRVIFSLRLVENLFFVLDSAQGCPQNLIRSFRIAAEKSTSFFPMVDKAADSLKLLFLHNSEPSLFRILEGLNILWMRRMISFTDLFNPDPPHLVSREEYDTTPEVQQKIATYLVKLEKSLLSCLKENQDLQLLVKFLPKGLDKATTIDQLQEFLKRIHGDKAAKLTETAPVINLLQQLLKAYLEAFGLLLAGKACFTTSGPPEEIIDEGYFASEVKSLLEMYDQLEELIFFAPRLNYQRWRALVRGDVKGNEGETTVVQALEALSMKIVTTGKKMAILWIPENFGPWLEKIITSPRLHQGKNLEEVVEDQIRTSLLLGSWCENLEIGKLRDRVEKSTQETLSIWKDFKRMASPGRIAEVASQWQLDLDA